MSVMHRMRQMNRSETLLVDGSVKRSQPSGAPFVHSSYTSDR